MSPISRRVAAMLAVLLPALAPAADIDPARSSIAATFSQMNVPVDAPFKRISGRLEFDAADPARTRAHLDIDTASFDLGNDDYSAEVRGPAWLDSTHFPRASFDVTSVKALGGNRYQVSGVLELKGRRQALSANATLGQAAGIVAFDGAVPISRSYFSIGDAEWKDTVADRVLVKFHIVAPAARTTSKQE